MYSGITFVNQFKKTLNQITHLLKNKEQYTSIHVISLHRKQFDVTYIDHAMTNLPGL